MNPQEAILSVQDVGVRFVRTDGTPAEALRSVSFKVFPGEFVCILGRSGHGKTTLLNVVAGLLSAHRGEVRVMDRPVIGPGSRPWRHFSAGRGFSLDAGRGKRCFRTQSPPHR